MIIYGWKTTPLIEKISKEIVCPNCNEKHTFRGQSTSSYFDIFWIPIFPYSKKTFYNCMGCGYQIKKKDNVLSLEQDQEELKRESKIPIWHFSGLFLITIFIAYMVINGNQQHKAELEYLANPLEGDVYEYVEDLNYSTFKLIGIQEDSVLYLPNTYETSQKSGISEIDVDSNYSADVYIMSKVELTKMYEDKIVYEINRN